MVIILSKYQASFCSSSRHTDHFPVGIFAEIACAQREAPIKRKKRPFYEIGKQLFSTLLPNIDIHGVPGRFNEVFEKYYNAIFQIYNIAFPVVMTELKGKTIVPWMTRELKQCIRKKRKTLQALCERCDT